MKDILLIKKALSVLLMVLLAALLNACGGGGGSSDDDIGLPEDPLQSLPYIGLMTPAIIAAEDVEEFMFFIQFGNDFSIAPMTHLTAMSAEQVSRGLALIPAAKLLESTPGACGGLMKLDLTVNDSTGDFQGSAVYEQYDDCELMVNGTVWMSGQININTLQLTRGAISFELLEVTTNELNSALWSGKSTITESGPLETISYDMRVRVGNTGKVYWFDGYQVTVMHGYDTRSYEEETITAGRFYDPDRGYVDMRTLVPIRTYEEDSWPSSGVVVVEGGVNTSARLSYISSVLYQVEADLDGDGSYEFDSGRVHFPGANILPVAAAGKDDVGNVGCQISLDGSQSTDEDQDLLQYEWTVASAPEGSSSSFSFNTSPTPLFIPDMKGVYQFSLSVFDGFDMVEDTVDITVYGDLFCLGEATIIPYALTGQYEADVAVGDVTADGMSDVLALTREAELYVFSQNLSGELADPVIYTVDNWRAVAVGDITGDGRKDAVVTTDDGVGVLQQSETGELLSMVEYLFDPPLTGTPYSYSLALGDFNNDAKLDAAVMPEGEPVYVFLQGNDGTLVPSSTHDILGVSWGSILAGDVTGDGLTDIVVSRDSRDDNIGVLPQDSVGGFGAASYYTIGNVPYTYTYAMALGDLNGDGRLDLGYSLRATNNSAFQIGVLPQTIGGTFGDSVFHDAYYPPIHKMIVADLTGDGRDDLVVLHGTPDTSLPFSPTTVAVFAATENGTLAPYDIYPLNQTQQSWGGLAVGDLDGDGRNDVVVTAHGCDELKLNCGPNMVILHGKK